MIWGSSFLIATYKGSGWRHDIIFLQSALWRLHKGGEPVHPPPKKSKTITLREDLMTPSSNVTLIKWIPSKACNNGLTHPWTHTLRLVVCFKCRPHEQNWPCERFCDRKQSITDLSFIFPLFSSTLQINNGGRVMRPLGVLRTWDEKETWPHRTYKTRRHEEKQGPCCLIRELERWWRLFIFSANGCRPPHTHMWAHKYRHAYSMSC